MAKKTGFDWNLIPDDNLIEDGDYTLVVEGFEQRNTDEGLLSYTATCRIRKSSTDVPVGTPVYMKFMIGTDSDPQAEQPATWRFSKGAKKLKKFIEVIGASELNKHPTDMATDEDLVGKKFLDQMSKASFTDRETGETREYQKHNLFPSGTTLAGPEKGGTVPKKAKPAPVAVDDDEEEEAPRKASKKAKPAPRDDDEEEEEE